MMLLAHLRGLMRVYRSSLWEGGTGALVKVGVFGSNR